MYLDTYIKKVESGMYSKDDLKVLSEDAEKLIRAIQKHKISKNADYSFMLWADTNPNIEKELTSDLYTEYRIWCHKYGCKPITQCSFGKHMRILGYVSKVFTINGMSTRLYVKEETTDW